MLIKTAIGNETFSSSGSIRLNAFWRKSAHDEESNLLIAARDQYSGIRQHGASELLPAGPTPHSGNWTMSMYNGDEGGILRMNVMSSKTGVGFAEYDLLLQLREEAAFHRIMVPLTADQHAKHTAMYFEGNFDLIPAAWYKPLGILGMGDTSKAKYADSTRAALRITIQEVEAAVKPFYPPEVLRILQKDGQTQALVKSTAPRRQILKLTRK